MSDRERKWSTLLPAVLVQMWVPVNASIVITVVLYIINVPAFVLYTAILVSSACSVIVGISVGVGVWVGSDWFPVADTKRAWLLVWRRSPVYFLISLFR